MTLLIVVSSCAFILFLFALRLFYQYKVQQLNLQEARNEENDNHEFAPANLDSVPIDGSPVRGNQVVPGIIKSDKINGKGQLVGFSVILSDGEFEEMENELKERSRISQ